MRQRIPMNFDWQYKSDYQESYLQDGGHFDDATVVDLPHTIVEVPLTYFDESIYQKLVTYRKCFPSPNRLHDDMVFLTFQGVAVRTTVYLNGTLVGVNEAPYTPFSFVITPFLKEEGLNECIVVVDGSEIKNIPPFGGVVDYLVYGGIYREVELEVKSAVYIDHVMMKTFDGGLEHINDMLLDTTILLSEHIEDAVIQLDVLDEGAAIAQFSTSTIDDRLFQITEHVKNITRWSLDQPKLYQVRISLVRSQGIVDQIETTMGFRTISFTHEGFSLNNQKIKLFGLNRHQSYPYMGYAAPKRLQEKDAEILKYQLGCNIVRTSHYMQSDHFIKRCDEIGLLVFEEIPGWQHIGDETFKERSLQNLKTMIVHHYNHPSICMWGVRINESPDDHDFYKRMNETAKLLDETRPTGGVRNFHGSELLEDVYTFNDFSHTGENEGLTKPRKVTKTLVPYLVTENNGHMFPTKKFDPEQKRFEQAHRHLMVHDASFRNEFIGGAISWCMADYHTHIQFGSGDRICHHGVLDMFRIPKYAAAVYASQQKAIPILEVMSNMVMGEYPASAIPPTYIFTNCDAIKVYKDEEYIDTYYSAWEMYPGIPNAPVIIDDYIADRIHKNESYSPRVATKLKVVLLSFVKHGIKLDSKGKWNLIQLMMFHKITIAKLMELYGRYVGDWGKEGSRYRYEGYINDECVIVKHRGSSKQFLIDIVPDCTVLHIQDTYDATRIVLRLCDEFDNDLPFAFDAFTIECSAHLQHIGPKTQSLNGGSVGVYVRTTGLKGTGYVRFHFERFGIKSVEITVK